MPMPAPAIADLKADPEALRPAELKLLRNTRPFNVWGLPAISVPCGFTQSGLPIGLQIAGAHWREDLVLRLALGLRAGDGRGAKQANAGGVVTLWLFAGRASVIPSISGAPSPSSNCSADKQPYRFRSRPGFIVLDWLYVDARFPRDATFLIAGDGFVPALHRRPRLKIIRPMLVAFRSISLEVSRQSSLRRTYAPVMSRHPSQLATCAKDFRCNVPLFVFAVANEISCSPRCYFRES